MVRDAEPFAPKLYEADVASAIALTRVIRWTFAIASLEFAIGSGDLSKFLA